MPKTALRHRRSGEDSRGAALVNADDALPNTSTSAWDRQYSGKVTTREALGIEDEENASPQRVGPSRAEVCTAMKRPLALRDVSQSGGKSPRTVQKRILTMLEVIKREADACAFYLAAEDVCKQAIANVEGVIRPEAERLGYDVTHLFSKYLAVRLYFAYRAAGHTAMGASEEGGWPILVSGSTVRTWANDFLSCCIRLNVEKPKEVLTFSPYGRGGHVEWLLDNEILEHKARKWIGRNAEVKGRTNMSIASFQRFLVGVYDHETKQFTERGLLTDVLEAKNKTGLALETARLYLQRLGYSYDFTRKNVYADGFDRPDVVEHRNNVFLPAMADAERRSYLWVPMAWLEQREHWPSEEAYKSWVDGGKPEVHVDRFEWKNDKTPNGIDRFAEWGPMGGVLSARKRADEKPVIVIKQDETCIRQYDTQKKAWRHDGAARSIAPKGEGAAMMYSGYICEQLGGFPMLTEAKVRELNKEIAERMQGQRPAIIARAQHDLTKLRAEGLITDVDGDGLPIASTEKSVASKIHTAPGLQQLEIGKNKEGYWDGDCQVEQAKKVQKIMQILFPDHEIVHVYDWSSGHHCFDDGALVASKMGAGPGGKQPLMHDTTVPVSECGSDVKNLKKVRGSNPPEYSQSMVFRHGDIVLVEKEGQRKLPFGDPLIGQPKGAMQVARERDIYRKGMTMKGPIKKDATEDEQRAAADDAEDNDDDDDEEKAVVRDLDLSVIHALSQMSDFKNEKCTCSTSQAPPPLSLTLSLTGCSLVLIPHRQA
jgi:hypothetical protein